MCRAFGCLPSHAEAEDVERCLNIMEMRAYRRAHRYNPKDGPGAALLWEVKGELKRMKDAGLVK